MAYTTDTFRVERIVLFVRPGSWGRIRSSARCPSAEVIEMYPFDAEQARGNEDRL